MAYTVGKYYFGSDLRHLTLATDFDVCNTWNGHVKCSNGAVKTAFDVQIIGKVGLGGLR